MKQLFLSEQRYRFRRFSRKAWSAFNSMHKAVNIGVVAGCVLTFAHATPTSAQNRTATVPDSTAGWEQELDELVVTSSKAELTLQQTAQLVTLITRAEIERQPAQSVQDLLKNIVGLDVRQRGSNGVLAGVSVRGGTFEQTAILLNGVNLTNPQTGHYNLDLPVNLSDIERIEIIQGPSSLLYGAGAFSGGVNIVTKKPGDTGVYLDLEGGMYSHAAATVRGSLQTGASAHSLSAGYASSDGYIANSDYRLFSALWQSRLTTEAARIDFQFGVNDKEYGANTFYSAKYPNQFDDTRSVFGVLRGEAGNRLKLIPQLYWNRHYDHYQLIRNTSTGENFHQTDVFGFNLNAQYRWAGGTTNLGGEIRNEGILSSNLGKDSIFDQANYRKTDHRSHIHYFLEHTYLRGGWTLSAGLMFHYNTAFPDASGLFPAIHTAYWLTGRVKLFASWSKAIRMPTFTDLSYTGPTHTGHSNVRPEQSESFDAGFQYHHPVGTVSISGFYMKAIEPIDWVKSLPGDPWEARNLDDFAKTGFEANVVWRFGSSAVHLGYRWMNQNQNDAGWITYYLDDYIRHKFTASLSHPVYKGISAEWQFRRQNRQGTYTQYENNESTGREVAYLGFSLLDLRLNWQLRDFRIHLTGNNLFNVSYYDLGNIPQPGFWLIGGVSWTMH